MDRSGWPERMPASELQPDSLLIEVSGTPRTPEQPAESPSKTGVGPVQACVRCRRSKRKCDGASLGCGRCVAAGVSCSRSDTAAGSDPPSSIRSGMMKEGESYTTATGGWRTKRRASPTGSDGGNDQDGSDQEEAAEESEAGEAASFNTVTGPAKKKRTRLCLSCVRCHRLKVKCDKALPCSRCVRGGLDNDCTYTHSQSTKPHNYLLQSPSFPFTSVGEMSRGVYDAWESIHRGDSHWKILIAQLSILCPRPSAPGAASAREYGNLKNYKTRPVLSSHFPFTSPPRGSKESLLALIPPKPIADRLVETYLGVYEQVTRVVHGPSLRTEVFTYFSNPAEVDMAWFSQFCMILGLGYLAFGGETRESRQDKARELFETAASCLASTPYLFRPSMAALRALCLMVTARLVAATACWDTDSSWPLLGMIVRLAILKGYHREDGDHPPFETEMRRRLWTTIVYLDLQLSIATGMPPQIRNEDFTALCPSNLNDEDLSPSHVGPISSRMFECTEASPQILLQHTFTLVLELVQKLNNPSTNKLSYEKVLSYNTQIRSQMKQANALKCGTLARMTLDIFFRRLLLSLHRRFSVDPDALVKYPVSYWASFECSLALLVHHRALCEETLAAAAAGSHGGNIDHSPDGDKKTIPALSPVDASALAGMFVMDFYAACLTACIHLLRPDPRFSTGTEEIDSIQMPSRRTIIETLRYCLEIWSSVAGLSGCYRIRVSWLDYALRCVLEADGSA